MNATIDIMTDFRKLLGDQFLEMRWRCLSLAADMDRLERSDAGAMRSDPQISSLREAMAIIMSPEPDRAERLQMLFSDQSREIGK
jgi:hypothetical protein